jgi:hypothetical protein
VLHTTLNIEPVTTQGEPVFAGDHIDTLIERGGASTVVVEDVEVVSDDLGGLDSPIQERITVAITWEQFRLLGETLGSGGKILFHHRQE